MLGAQNPKQELLFATTGKGKKILLDSPAKQSLGPQQEQVISQVRSEYALMQHIAAPTSQRNSSGSWLAIPPGRHTVHSHPSEMAIHLPHPGVKWVWSRDTRQMAVVL